jgi:CO dehydrogenase maturation factor
MKIAVVGKGGSGKSTISWLLVNYLANAGQRVLAIDADHNQDLTTNLGFEVKVDTPTIHHSHQEFREVMKLEVKDKWSKIVLEPQNHHFKFSYQPSDELTAKLTQKIAENIDLIIGGLGDEDTLFSDKCSHGQLSPLKYYLPFLKLNANNLIVDSVAGTDMIKYGLYVSCQAIICVVEPNVNSIKVFEQIRQTGEKTDTKVLAILNKIPEKIKDMPEIQQSLYQEFIKTNADYILGQICIDITLLSHNYQQVSNKTKNSLENIASKLAELPEIDGQKALVDFELKKIEIINKKSS